MLDINSTLARARARTSRTRLRVTRQGSGSIRFYAPPTAVGCLRRIAGAFYTCSHPQHPLRATRDYRIDHTYLTMCQRLSTNERPLYESATQRLASAVRQRSVEDLAALVVDMHHDGRLCVPPAPESAGTEPTIVCTMGMRSQANA